VSNAIRSSPASARAVIMRSTISRLGWRLPDSSRDTYDVTTSIRRLSSDWLMPRSVRRRLSSRAKGPVMTLLPFDRVRCGQDCRVRPNMLCYQNSVGSCHWLDTTAHGSGRAPAPLGGVVRSPRSSMGAWRIARCADDGNGVGYALGVLS